MVLPLRRRSSCKRHIGGSSEDVRQGRLCCSPLQMCHRAKTAPINQEFSQARRGVNVQNFFLQAASPLNLLSRSPFTYSRTCGCRNSNRNPSTMKLSLISVAVEGEQKSLFIANAGNDRLVQTVLFESRFFARYQHGER